MHGVRRSSAADTERLVQPGERGDGVAAGEDEIVDPGRFECPLLVLRPPGQQHALRARRLQRAGGRLGQLGVEPGRSRRCRRSQRRCRRTPCRPRPSCESRSLADRLDAAGGEKFRIQVERAEWAARSPRLARNTCGRLPVFARCASAASRSRSNGSARRRAGRAATEVPPLTMGSAAGCGSTLTPSSPSRAKAETPVSCARPAAMSLARASATRPISPCTKPLSSAARHAALGLDLLEQRPGLAWRGRRSASR